jgi:hypothetical protein
LWLRVQRCERTDPRGGSQAHPSTACRRQEIKGSYEWRQFCQALSSAEARAAAAEPGWAWGRFEVGCGAGHGRELSARDCLPALPAPWKPLPAPRTVLGMRSAWQGGSARQPQAARGGRPRVALGSGQLPHTVCCGRTAGAACGLHWQHRSPSRPRERRGGRACRHASQLAERLGGCCWRLGGSDRARVWDGCRGGCL